MKNLTEYEELNIPFGTFYALYQKIGEQVLLEILIICFKHNLKTQRGIWFYVISLKAGGIAINFSDILRMGQ